MLNLLLKLCKDKLPVRRVGVEGQWKEALGGAVPYWTRQWHRDCMTLCYCPSMPVLAVNFYLGLLFHTEPEIKLSVVSTLPVALIMSW